MKAIHKIGRQRKCRKEKKEGKRRKKSVDMKKNQKEVMKKGTNIILHTYARAYQQIKHNLQNKRTKYVGGNKILNKKKERKIQ